jgi:CO dehydrogenase maturation factor
MSGRTIVVCGKGGVGKTTVSAILCRRLAAAASLRTLAVDADHAGGLGLALGLDPAITLRHVREQSLADLASGATSRKADLHQSVEYRLAEALTERDSLAFLALGRPEEQGCFCAVNSVLKRALAHLSSQFDLTLVDAEAGLEQINRDVVGDVDLLLLVSDTSVKSLRVAEAIRRLATRLGRARDCGLVINRVPNEATAQAVLQRTDLPLLGWIPTDDEVTRFDAEARPFFEMGDTPATLAVDRALAPFLD